MTTKRWILILLPVILACTGWLIWQGSVDHGPVVCMTQNGAVIHTIDLSQVDAPYSITISDGAHYNIVEVTSETVWVSEANCENQVCVEHGALEQNGSPITCLPHRLIIFWEESQVDG